MSGRDQALDLEDKAEPEKNAKKYLCPICEGEGEIYDSRDSFRYGYITCTLCKGKGILKLRLIIK